jgi:arylsulfatase A-like enzyme
LKSILKPSANIVELDRDVDWQNYDLVRTLSELQNRLTTTPGAEQPFFVYSQPQNIHLVSLKGNQRRPALTKNYDDFEPQHAFEVERIDQAFGEFVEFLKAGGLYDNSIIVLTADHGDSLGEDGHWGHGNSIYPEVIRIPLIVHLPSELQRTLVWNPTDLAFSTDITPSLYYLLGHRPVTNYQLLGRPLFTRTLEEQQAYKRDAYLVADSYGPVYGLLRDNGRSLFVADAGKNKAYVYDLTRGYGGRRVNVSDDLTSECEKLIALDLHRIQAFYKFQPQQQLTATRPQSSTIAQLYSLLFSH